MRKAFSLLRGIHLWTGVSAVLGAGLFVLTDRAPGAVSRAQFCNPASVSYLVRDEQGKLLTAEELRSIAEQLPKSIGDARIYVGEVSLAEDGERFYPQEAADADRGEKAPALQFINSGTCAMRLGEITLTWRGKQMRLVFNLEITRAQEQRLRRWVLDAPPFQAGVFALDVDGWPRYENEVIPAERWRTVPDRTPARAEAQSQLITDGKTIFKPVLSALQKTRAPLRLPDYLAAEEESSQLYAVIDEIKPASYALQVAFEPDCLGGTACRYGFVEGQAYGARAKRLRGKPVRLARGLTGYFIAATCEANCGYSTLSWLQNGYQYTVGIYAAELPTLRKAANSAIANSGGNQ
jgi:hypothetical protein